MLEQKREALTRRADMLLRWLQQRYKREYAYSDSVNKLLSRINLMVWALEKSIEPQDWKAFKQAIYNARNVITDFTKTEEEEKENYYKGLNMLEKIIGEYKEYVQSDKLTMLTLSVEQDTEE